MQHAPGECACGCRDPRGAAVHAINAALRVDDVDRAIEAGLLDRDLQCTSCSDDCRAVLHAARDARSSALAARERYRTRNARLERIARERALKRSVVPSSEATPSAPKPALPSAAAAALARAREKAAQRHKP
ncbi:MULTISPECIES: hypothetical protein [unclassified Lysobacter]|uniref:hypothetical protein n=1 Tax=unclassified Lysobacter TaxID=2635362 RepID=UPI001C241F88|nr:hypothetical protein [Lysobacter sp. MMG2]MBU8974998.1 hypothetical protein [Lysobacter sp. MMG2]